MNDHACDSVYNYEAYKGLWSSMNAANMHEIAYALERQSGDKPWDLYTGKHLLDFVDNHDVPRIATQLADKKQLKPLYGLLFGMCGVPCVYYGSEWGIEGARTSTCDDMLRPAIAPEQFAKLHNDLTDHIGRLAKLHRQHPALCTGMYRELLLTNRQYAYARSLDEEHIITAVNIDENGAFLSFRLPMGGKEAVDLVSGEKIAIDNGCLNLALDGCESKILKIVG